MPEDPAEADAWWAEREPAQLIVGLTRPYHRFQGIPDHALGERTQHAADMLAAAEDAPILRHNHGDIDREDISSGYIHDTAIDGGVDPDSAQVGEAVLWMLGVDPTW